MDQNQIQRLLLALREECAAIRKREEELFELLVSYKDQIQDLKTTMLEKLSGLPKSPYIAGMLVPAPGKVDGVDDFRHMLATYLHKNDGTAPDPAEKPADLVFEKPPEVKADDIELEPDETAERPRRGRDGGDRSDRPRRPRDKEDNDLQRGPERDVEPFDLHDDADEADDADEGSGGSSGSSGSSGGGDDDDGNKRRRRRRGGRGRRREGSSGSGGGGSAGGSAPSGDA